MKKPLVYNVAARYLPPWASALIAGIITGSAQLLAAPDLSNLFDAVQHILGTEPNLAWLPAPLAALLAYIVRRAPAPAPAPTAEPLSLSRRPALRRTAATEAIPTGWQRTNERYQQLSERVTRLERLCLTREDYSGATALNIRQNNPLNIRSTPPTKTRWHGEIPSENGFALFETPEDGMRAAMYLLVLVYFQRYKLLTLREIILRWAPPASRGGDNTDAETAHYISRVAAAMGYPEDRLLEIDVDYGELVSLVKAMGEVEGGHPLPYPPSCYARAVLALPTMNVSRELARSAQRVLAPALLDAELDMDLNADDTIDGDSLRAHDL